MITNKIKTTFDEIAQIYDTQRRALIPCYDDFYNIVTELIKPGSANINVLDIGAGTGLLTSFIFRKFPDYHYTLFDVSDEMLSIAKQRFAGFSNIKYLTGDYHIFDFDDKYDIVLSALSIHHFTDPDKELLYNKIFHVLNEGGIFINADQVMAPFEEIEKKYHENWISKVEETNLSNEEKAGAYQRMKLDIPGTLNNNLLWLKNAGFFQFDVIYKYYNFVVLYAKK